MKPALVVVRAPTVAMARLVENKVPQPEFITTLENVWCGLRYRSKRTLIYIVTRPEAWACYPPLAFGAELGVPCVVMTVLPRSGATQMLAKELKAFLNPRLPVECWRGVEEERYWVEELLAMGDKHGTDLR